MTFGGSGDDGTWSNGRKFAIFWRLLASTRMSLSSPQNSAWENRASFCRPWFLVADKWGFVGKNGTPPISGFGEHVDQTKSKLKLSSAGYELMNSLVSISRRSTSSYKSITNSSNILFGISWSFPRAIFRCSLISTRLCSGIIRCCPL